MYGFTLIICTFVLCIRCAQSAPPSAALLSALLSPSSSSQPAREKQQSTGLTTYDQKQTGKYNIHLNIKDVAIIALDAGGLNSGVGDFSEDYYEDYDLADFTVKPIAGLIDITSDKPTSTTAAPALIHIKPDASSSANETETETSTASEIEEPIIKDPVKEPINKTQSIVILDATPAPGLVSAQSVTIVSDDASVSPSGIVVTTSTPAPEALPPKPSIIPALFPTKPNEIPVQIILEPLPAQKQTSRQRPHGNWRLRNRIRATPSHNRRITPPPDAEDPSYFAPQKFFKPPKSA